MYLFIWKVSQRTFLLFIFLSSRHVILTKKKKPNPPRRQGTDGRSIVTLTRYKAANIENVPPSGENPGEKQIYFQSVCIITSSILHI